MKKSQTAIALAFLGLMFFSIGFALGINSFLIPVLRTSLGVSSGISYLVLTATFLPFVLFSYPVSRQIARRGYKTVMFQSLLMFAVAFLAFMNSAEKGNLYLFLLASFASGIANTALQAAVNPYITILGPMESAARRISFMGICNKIAWAVAPVFLAWLIGKEATATAVADLQRPFMVIIAVFFALGIVSILVPLPEVKALGEEEERADECPYAASKRSIWQFPHLILGAVTLFFYVGAETVALSTGVDYAGELGLADSADYAWLASIGMVVGYVCGIVFIPRYLSQAMALRVCSWIGIAGSLAVCLLPGALSIWGIAAMALGCSLMWPALWPLAMKDLGRFTKTGSSLLVTAIAGGAVVPLLFGFLKDGFGSQHAYWITLPCFVLILYYGTYGYKIRR
ncbi:MAG: glucose/galactose MFS transporter [Rikenellaceae bacterium]|nr:glucose/galactose MFS transporter [Rikenellaceae bacterium]